MRETKGVGREHDTPHSVGFLRISEGTSVGEKKTHLKVSQDQLKKNIFHVHSCPNVCIVFKVMNFVYLYLREVFVLTDLLCNVRAQTS